MNNNKKNSMSSNKTAINNKKMKYYAVRLYPPPSKSPVHKWSDKKNLIELEIDSYIKQGESMTVSNYSLVTGKTNDLSIVDIDFKTPEEKATHPFLIQYGFEPEEWSKRWGCPVVKSASGGFHIYFKYDDRIPTIASKTKSDCATLGIDLRGNSHKGVDGGLIICPGSKMPHGSYDMICGHINDRDTFPEDLYDWLRSKNLVGDNPSKKEQKTLIKKMKVGNKFVTVEEIIGCDQSLYKYDLPDDLLHKVIKGLPQQDYFNTYQGYLLFTTAMKQINRKDIYYKYPKLNNPAGGRVDSKEHKEWLDTNWDGVLTGHKTIYAINKLLIESTFKDARLALDYFKYKPLLPNTRKPDKTINKAKLGYSFFDECVAKNPDKKYFICKSDTGTGKTTSFKHYAKNNSKKFNGNFVSLVSRISLGLEQYDVFNNHGLSCLFYDYDNYETDNGYVIQIDSLLKLRNAFHKNLLNDNVLFLDEFNSLIKHLLTSDTLSQKGTRIPVMDLLLDVMSCAKYVFMTDADISDPAIEFLDYLDASQVCYVQNIYKHNRDKPTEEFFDVNKMITKMKDTPKWICPCDWASTANMLKEAIGDKNIIVIDAQTTERYNWDEHDRIIFSPKVIYGLDSVMERPVFCNYQETTIDAGDMLQQINRNRNITKLYYLFERRKCMNTAFNTIRDAQSDTDDLEKWCQKNDHLHQEISRVHPIFKNIFNKYKYNRDAYMSNPYGHFRRLLVERGFIVDNTIIGKVDKFKSKNLLTENKERLISEVHKDLDYVKRKNEYIKMPEEEIENFKEVFVDTQFIGRYLTAKKYIFETFGQFYDPQDKIWESWHGTELESEIKHIEVLKDKLYKKEEFNINKIKLIDNKLVFLDKLRNELKIPNKLQINGFEVLATERQVEYYKEYQAIFTDRSKVKDNPLKTVLGTQQLINKIFKSLFGISPFAPIDTTVKGVKVRGFEDAKLENFGNMYNIFKVSQDKSVACQEKVWEEGDSDSDEEA